MMQEARWMVRAGWRAVQSAPGAWLRQWRAWRRFWRTYRDYCRLAPAGERPAYADLFPCVNDATTITPVEPMYFYQDAWAFAAIARSRPERHVDVGSHHKFVSLLAQVVPTVMVDIRPVGLPLRGLEFRQGSILALPFTDGSVPSLSSLCVVEHIGLGRYGDPLDPQGTPKAIAELKRVIAPCGNLYISLILDDRARVFFNAHRAITETEALSLFAPFDVVDSRYIQGQAFLDARPSGGCCACYHLRKPG